MRIVSLILLVTGWIIVLAAVVMLAPGPAQVVFVLASLGIELAGFVLIARSYASPPRPEGLRGARH
jgi:hypothetical protein